MNLEELKGLNITEFNSDEITKHIETIMTLVKEDKKDYLLFALNNYYSIDEETKNTDVIERFFSYEDFKPFYKELMAELMVENKNEVETDN